MKTDLDGHSLAFDLTGGEKGNTPHFPILLDIGHDIKPRAAVGDKGSNTNHQYARQCGAVPVIPPKSNEKHQPKHFAKKLYKARARIEQAFGKLKRFKRVALRCEKTQQNYRSIISLAAITWKR